MLKNNNYKEQLDDNDDTFQIASSLLLNKKFKAYIMWGAIVSKLVNEDKISCGA
jgi:hypothetical protein